MEINPYPVEIKDRFYRSFEQIYEFILGQSYQSSQRLNREIVDIISLICERPDSFNIGRITNSGKIFRYAKVMRSYKVYFLLAKIKFTLLIFYTKNVVRQLLTIWKKFKTVRQHL